MSYPRQIQTLIVEDEEDPRENYEALFTELRATCHLAPPVFAGSCEEAAERLREPRIWHLLILDLGLPHATRGIAEPEAVPGEGLLLKAAARDEYPIPAVLVVSGRSKFAHLRQIRERLEREFWHGCFVVKGGLDEEDEIKTAIAEIQRYCDVGIHLRDARGRLCPTLSPREEDLLRRCVLAREEQVGVDLEWWGGYRASSSAYRSAERAELVKVLMGNFLLKDRLGPSRPAFFKFEASEDASYSHRDACVLHQKLQHVQVECTLSTGQRSLLVTRTVGESAGPPVPLCAFLARTDAQVSASLPRIAEDIATQQAQLGTVVQKMVPLQKVLWPFQLEMLQAAWSRHGNGIEPEPLRLLEHLRQSIEQVWLCQQECTHGDLNATNVAIDPAPAGARAYIFDAAGMRSSPALNDLATLEVTTLLHQSATVEASLVKACAGLYSHATVEPPAPDGVSPVVRHSWELITGLRTRALQRDELRIYALLVFNAALMQLEGLAFQIQNNKICNPPDAVLLVRLAAGWLRVVAPDWCGPRAPDSAGTIPEAVIAPTS